MAEVIYKKGLSTNLTNVPIKEGQILVTTDTAEMYVDMTDSERKKIAGGTGEGNKTLVFDTEEDFDDWLKLVYYKKEVIARGVSTTSPVGTVVLPAGTYYMSAKAYDIIDTEHFTNPSIQFYWDGASGLQNNGLYTFDTETTIYFHLWLYPVEGNPTDHPNGDLTTELTIEIQIDKDSTSPSSLRDDGLTKNDLNKGDKLIVTSPTYTEYIWNGSEAIPVELPESGVGRTTTEGGEIFNDYENNISGITGYHVFGLSLNSANNSARLFIPSVKTINYSVGDVVNLDLGPHYYQCFKISEITNDEPNVFITIVPIEKTITINGKEEKYYLGNIDNLKLDPDTVTGAPSYDNFVWVVGKEGEAVCPQSIHAHTEGMNNKAFGLGAHAEGKDVIAIGNHSHAEGRTTKANYASHAEGKSTQALGQMSHAEGDRTQAEGAAAHAEGILTKAIGAYSHSEGSTTIAFGTSSHAEGNLTQAIGEHAHAEGEKTIAVGKNSHAGGLDTIASRDNQTVIGMYSAKDDDALFIVGNGKLQYKTTTDTSPIAGTTYYTYDTTKKIYNKFTGEAFVEGVVYYVVDDDATRKNAFVVKDTGDVIINGKTAATTNYVTSLLNNYTPKEDTVGRKNTSGGEIFNYYGSYTENGITYQNVASGSYSHAEGYNTKAQGSNSHAEGGETTVDTTGSCGHAEGYKTTASGECAHAEGSWTKAKGQFSHAEGRWTNASGKYSHAGGLYTQATAEAQTAIGKYNAQDDDALFIVGNGTNQTNQNRSNAFVIKDSKEQGALLHGQNVATVAWGTEEEFNNLDTTTLPKGFVFFITE